MEPTIRWSSEIPTKIKKRQNRPVVGLDRDGVLNVDKGTYIGNPADFEPIPNSLEAVAKLRYEGYKIVVITNQGGIAKGIVTQQQVEQVNHRMFELLGQAGCPSIDGLYFSESSSKQDMYAKPNTGMFKRAETEIPGIKFAHGGYYVGDKISDLKAAQKIGAKPILVRTGHGKETEELLNKRFTYRPLKKVTLVFDDLADFVKYLDSKD